MSNFFYKLNKNSIIAGLVSTILFIYFLQPILNFLGKILVSIFKNLSTALYNRLFQEIARGTPEYSYTILQSTCVLFVGLLVFAIVRRVAKPKSSEDQTETDEPRVKKSGILTFFLTLAVLWTIMLIVLSDIKLKTIQSFEQQIKIVTPYVDTHTRDLLISDFSRMENEDDYRRIQNQLNEIAQKNDIQFPKTRTHFF